VLCSETLGIRLKGAVLIVDEAHNLPEAVADSAAAALTGSGRAAAGAAVPTCTGSGTAATGDAAAFI
jgi:Rad3-related DNA helicase